MRGGGVSSGKSNRAAARIGARHHRQHKRKWRSRSGVRSNEEEKMREAR